MSTRDAPTSMPQTVIGLDVGGTKVSAALMRAGRLSEPVLVPTDRSGSAALLDQFCQQVGALREEAGVPVDGVGIGIPSVVEFATGRVRSSVNIPLADVPLREALEQRLGLPVFVDNDASCAALAEAHDEQGQLDVRNLVMFTVGTGVGGGIVVGGRVYRGATGAAGELGHTLIGAQFDEHGPEVDGFPQPGSLERLGAGRALDALARDAAARDLSSALGRALAQTGAVSGRDAVRAAHEGDPGAIAVIGQLGRRLGVGVANAINTFDPDVVAIGGGVSTAGDLLLNPVRETALPLILPGVGTRTEVRLARSGPAAGVRGAALLAREELAAHHVHDLAARAAAT